MTSPDRHAQPFDRDRRSGAAAHLEPGLRVHLPARPDWGAGQVQSVAGTRVTVNFENAGKVLVNVAAATLESVDGRF